jgi:ferric-dicitrate binding protein FerR (iron transport regulator)
MAAAVLITIAVALWRRPEQAPAGATAVATVEAVNGAALLEPRHLAPGPSSGLASGDTITTGESGRAALRLASGHALRLDVGSAVRIVSERTLALERGAIYVEGSDGADRQGGVEVETPFGVVTDVGTRFEVRLVEENRGDGEHDGDTAHALEVRVRDGAVRLTTERGTFEAVAGNALHVERGGDAERATAAPYGEAWRWVEAVRPPVEIEGTSLESFLDWAARESGRHWRFTDADTAAGAAGTVIHGSIDGLDVEAALTTVLPSCGLRHRVEGDVLVIEGYG